MAGPARWVSRGLPVRRAAMGPPAGLVAPAPAVAPAGSVPSVPLALPVLPVPAGPAARPGPPAPLRPDPPATPAPTRPQTAKGWLLRPATAHPATPGALAAPGSRTYSGVSERLVG